MSAHVTRRSVVVGLLLLLAPYSATSPFSGGPATLGADSGTAFSGQATVVRVTLPPPAGTIVLSDTGPLPQSGGALEASLLNVSVPNLLTAEVAHASTIGQGDRSRSEASVANLALTVDGNTIGAAFLMSNAMAVCGPGGPSTSGSSEIAELVINGQQITVGTAPNQMIALPDGGQVVINQQSSNGPGDITVNALHVTVPQIADVVIASAHADITCQNPPPQPCPGSDFVTGGGWIPTPAGAKANFAVAGGIKNGGLWGHLEYIDHGNGHPKVHGTGVTAYAVTGPTTRHIEGTADIDGTPGTYKVDVADNGDPGRNVDMFGLTLSTGYSVPSTLLGGGNIQLHMPCQ
jgi:hypothetical protein